MTWREALEQVVARTRHERYRWLTSDDNPDAAQREGYRASLIQQASGALGAIGRAIGAAVTGEPVMMSQEEQERRWAICLACEHLDGEQCKICGCHMPIKTWGAQEHCPIDKW